MREDCSICGAQLYATEGQSFYEIIHSYRPNHSYGELEVVIPDTTHEYFCSGTCMVKFVRERIEPDLPFH